MLLASEIPLPRASTRARRDDEPDAPSSSSPCAAIRRRLAETKARVPEARQRLGARRWDALVNAPSAVERLSRFQFPPQRCDGGAQVVNRAYHKLHEIALSCALPTVATSVHLCEAPGGFVQCVSDHLRSEDGEWRWIAVTLREGVPVASTALLPRDRGDFVLADVLREEEEVVSRVRATFPDGADLVTADGAAAMDHARIEEEHRPLLMAQTRIALRCLRRGGVLVLKTFESLRPETRDLVAHLTQRFETVSFIKPGSSRPTNSERYLVCRAFDGVPMHEDGGERVRRVHADGWVREYVDVVERLAVHQIDALDRVLASVYDRRQ